MKDILRFPGGTRRDPAIDQWLNEQPDELRPFAQKWFARMRQCGADVRELIHDDQPTACVGDVPFGYVDVFTSHVNVGFFQGARLDDPAGLLQGTGKYMRHVKLKPGREPNEARLKELIDAAYRECRALAAAWKTAKDRELF